MPAQHTHPLHKPCEHRMLYNGVEEQQYPVDMCLSGANTKQQHI